MLIPAFICIQKGVGAGVTKRFLPLFSLFYPIPASLATPRATVSPPPLLARPAGQLFQLRGGGDSPGAALWFPSVYSPELILFPARPPLWRPPPGPVPGRLLQCPGRRGPLGAAPPGPRPPPPLPGALPASCRDRTPPAAPALPGSISLSNCCQGGAGGFLLAFVSLALGLGFYLRQKSS
ncbi:basic proline-rich protein-like [Manacus candei]|uniref:basic proline-rich protein-like n=1 Tax=Manacus candei TaxID=415023 RepID=UPI002225C489|nr:basic proline-rich protein-like [Manacus candei]